LLGLGGAAVPPPAPFLGAQVCSSVGCPCGAVPPQHCPAAGAAPPQHVPAFVPAPANSGAARPLPRGWGPPPCRQPFSPTKSILLQSRGLRGCWYGSRWGCAASCALGEPSAGPQRGGMADGPLCPAAWPLPSGVHRAWPCIHIVPSTAQRGQGPAPLGNWWGSAPWLTVGNGGRA